MTFQLFAILLLDDGHNWAMHGPGLIAWIMVAQPSTLYSLQGITEKISNGTIVLSFNYPSLSLLCFALQTIFVEFQTNISLFANKTQPLAEKICNRSSPSKTLLVRTDPSHILLSCQCSLDPLGDPSLGSCVNDRCDLISVSEFQLT